MGDIGIIGCGPAGLLAAHAAVRAGWEPTIFAPGAMPSPPAPGVFLHTAIPDVTDPKRPDATVRFRKVGRESVYARKVYGRVKPTSWRKFKSGRPYPAWALDPLYRQLWNLYGDLVQSGIVKGTDIKDFMGSYHLTINTAPLVRLCIGGHNFPHRHTWYVNSAPNWVRRNEMIYNGNKDDKWFRASNLFGRKLMEYATNPGERALRGVKVEPTDCDCHPGMLRVGRWGTWQPGVLLHHAYEEAENAVQRL